MCLYALRSMYVRYDFRIKICSVHLQLQLFVGGFMSYFHYLWGFFVCIVVSNNMFCFCCVCLRLVYPTLTVSLDCPFFIASSVFSKVCFINCCLGSLFNSTIYMSQIRLDRHDGGCQPYLATGQCVSPGTPVSSTSKTEHYDIIEILLKVALSTVTSPQACTITIITMGNRFVLPSFLYIICRCYYIRIV